MGQVYIKKIKLGETINVRSLNNEIESIKGVVEFSTVRTDIDLSIPGLSLCIYNPIYKGRDLETTDTVYKLKPFQIPYIENEEVIKSKIKVTDPIYIPFVRPSVHPHNKGFWRKKKPSLGNVFENLVSLPIQNN